MILLKAFIIFSVIGFVGVAVIVLKVINNIIDSFYNNNFKTKSMEVTAISYSNDANSRLKQKLITDWFCRSDDLNPILITSGRLQRL